MKVLAILAHDDPDSLNAYLFNKVVQYLNDKGTEVETLYLYQYSEKIPFYFTDKKRHEETKFFKDNQKLFMEADHLLVMYPVYWYSYPAILKAWIDLITNYAWSYSGGAYAKPKHKIKSSLVVNTSMAPVWFRKSIQGDLSCRQFKAFCRWIGIKKNYAYRIGSSNKLTEEDVEKHLKNIFHCCGHLIK